MDRHGEVLGESHEDGKTRYFEFCTRYDYATIECYEIEELVNGSPRNTNLVDNDTVLDGRARFKKDGFTLTVNGETLRLWETEEKKLVLHFVREHLDEDLCYYGPYCWLCAQGHTRDVG